MGYIFHESAYVDSAASIKDNTYIGHHCVIEVGAAIGSDCLIGPNCYVAQGATIGNNVFVGSHVAIPPSVTLENMVYCGSNVAFSTCVFPRAPLTKDASVKPIFVSTGASLGDSTTVLAGVTVGEYAFAAPGSVVAKNVYPYAIVAGNPATQRGWICQCGSPLDETTFKCPCGRAYTLNHAGSSPVLTEK